MSPPLRTVCDAACAMLWAELSIARQEAPLCRLNAQQGLACVVQNNVAYTDQNAFLYMLPASPTPHLLARLCSV